MDTSFQYKGATKKETVENHLKKSCNIVMHILLQGRMKRKKKTKIFRLQVFGTLATLWHILKR